jgi:hypothetical protein
MAGLRRQIVGAAKKRIRSKLSSHRKHLDELLDEALEESFPASDPVAIDVGRPLDRAHEAPRRGRSRCSG